MVGDVKQWRDMFERAGMRSGSRRTRSGPAAGQLCYKAVGAADEWPLDRVNSPAASYLNHPCQLWPATSDPTHLSAPTPSGDRGQRLLVARHPIASFRSVCRAWFREDSDAAVKILAARQVCSATRAQITLNKMNNCNLQLIYLRNRSSRFLRTSRRAYTMAMRRSPKAPTKQTPTSQQLTRRSGQWS
jgi:hypothetical protein